jgi:hypothetical protein
LGIVWIRTRSKFSASYQNGDAKTLHQKYVQKKGCEKFASKVRSENKDAKISHQKDVQKKDTKIFCVKSMFRK